MFFTNVNSSLEDMKSLFILATAFYDNNKTIFRQKQTTDDRIVYWWIFDDDLVWLSRFPVLLHQICTQVPSVGKVYELQI